MLGLFVAMLLGIGIGLVRGGSWVRLEHAGLRQMPILFGAVGVQLIASFVQPVADGWLAFALVLLSFGGIGVFAYANRREIGMPLIALGAFSNLLVIAVNGGMPVSREALADVGLRDPFTGSGDVLLKGAHRALTDDSRLTFLADIIPLHLGRNVISVGDILIWAGIVLLLQHLFVGRGRHASGTARTAPPDPAE